MSFATAGKVLHHLSDITKEYRLGIQLMEIIKKRSELSLEVSRKVKPGETYFLGVHPSSYLEAAKSML